MREPSPSLYVAVIVGVIAGITAFGVQGVGELLRESRAQHTVPSIWLVFFTFGWRCGAGCCAVALVVFSLSWALERVLEFRSGNLVEICAGPYKGKMGRVTPDHIPGHNRVTVEI